MFPAVHRRACVAAVMRYETPFIIEWVAWHRMLGFDVMIADNDTEGRQSELLKKLDVAGIIRRFDVTGIRVMPQIPAYHAMFHAALDAGYSYIGFLDADEFFEPFESGDVRGSGARLIKNMFSDTAAAAIGFNWMVFGSSGHTKPSDDLVTDRFTKSAQKDFGPNRCFKSFLDLGRCFAICEGQNMCDVMHPHGLKIGADNYSHDGFPMRLGANEAFGVSDTVGWRRARVRHYVVKTKAEFMRDKAARGQADAIIDPRYTNEFFAEYDRNEVNSPVSTAFRDLLKTEMKSIRFALAMSPAVDDQTHNLPYIARAIEQFGEHRVKEKIKHLSTQIDAIYGSKAWKVASTLRKISQLIKRPKWVFA
jgi:hypothetical protein